MTLSLTHWLTDWLTHSLTDRTLLIHIKKKQLKSEPRDLWPLRHETWPKIAVQNSSIGLFVPLSVCLLPLNNQSLHNTTEWTWTLVIWDIWSEWWGLIEETWPVNFFSTFSQHSFNFHSTFFYIFFNFFTFLSTFFQLFLTFFSNFFSNLCTSIGIWDTADYSTDNWGPGFMTIFVTLQLIVTLDSIRNSCDVFSQKHTVCEGGR